MAIHTSLLPVLVVSLGRRFFPSHVAVFPSLVRSYRFLLFILGFRPIDLGFRFKEPPSLLASQIQGGIEGSDSYKRLDQTLAPWV